MTPRDIRLTTLRLDTASAQMLAKAFAAEDDRALPDLASRCRAALAVVATISRERRELVDVARRVAVRTQEAAELLEVEHERRMAAKLDAAMDALAADPSLLGVRLAKFDCATPGRAGQLSDARQAEWDELTVLCSAQMQVVANYLATEAGAEDRKTLGPTARSFLSAAVRVLRGAEARDVNAYTHDVLRRWVDTTRRLVAVCNGLDMVK